MTKTLSISVIESRSDLVLIIGEDNHCSWATNPGSRINNVSLLVISQKQDLWGRHIHLFRTSRLNMTHIDN